MENNLLSFLKDNCRGKDRAAKVRDLAWQFKCSEREIRDELRRLNLDGEPVFTLVSPPYGAYYGDRQEDTERYWHTLNSRVLATLERMRAVSKIRTKEMLKGQLEMFE